MTSPREYDRPIPALTRMDDEALLASGEHARLLARYETIVVQRCVARLRGHPDAEDVAQDVKLRLWRELQAGKTYRVPYRVVVHKVVEWTLKDHWSGRDTTVPLPEGWEPGSEDDPVGPMIVREMLAELPPREREVWTLFLDGHAPDQIAELLAITRNNVDQALHRGRLKLRETHARG
jgi:DNA-directed RNA polymerase specialized sigma24 family protein